MTTIAYRDGILAADSLQTAHGTRIGYRTKIVRASDGSLLASTGHASYGTTLATWAAETHSGIIGVCPPPLPPTDDSRGLHISADGSIAYLESAGRAESTADFIAIGSGTDIALGAMAAGATAEEAVEIACQFDISTGGAVYALRLGDKQ